MGYANIDQVRQRFRIPDTTDDARLSELIDVASAMIDRDTGQRFGQYGGGTLVKTLTPDDPCLLHTPAIASGTLTLKTDDDGDGTFETTWAAADYELDGVGANIGTIDPYTTIRAVNAKTFPVPSAAARQRVVQVTGTWGYPATPDAIVEATMLLVSRLWHRAGSPLGAQAIGDGGALFVRSTDPDYQHLIAPFVRYEVD
jgi:hypothetical protein